MTDYKLKTETNDTDDKKHVSVVEEARSIRDEIVKAKDELKAENDRTAKLQAENLLGGEAGGHIETKTKETTPAEYAKEIEDKIASGEYE